MLYGIPANREGLRGQGQGVRDKANADEFDCIFFTSALPAQVVGPLLAQLIGEVVHVRQQLVLRQLARRARVDVVDLDTRRERYAPRQLGIVAARSS